MIKPILISISLTIFIFSSNAIAVEPLSCRMQIMLHMVVAMGRDKGISRQDSTKAIGKDGELTQREVNEIINNVYTKYKNKSQEEIGSLIEKGCR